MEMKRLAMSSYTSRERFEREGSAFSPSPVGMIA